MQHDGPDRTSSRISGLADLLTSAERRGLSPVERWNPPYCGDIGLAIAADGTWHYQQSPIRRMELVKLFARVLRRDPEGRHFLVTPAEMVDVAVADAPFLAVEMEVRRADGVQYLTFRTNVDDIVTVGAANPLRFTVDASNGGLKPYVLVRGRLEALVTRSLTMDLVALAVEDQDGRLGLWSGGVWFGVGRG